MARAVLVNDRTITIRANDVIKINRLGAKDRTVNRNNSVTDVETFPGSLSENTERSSFIDHHAPVPSNAQVHRDVAA